MIAVQGPQALELCRGLTDDRRRAAGLLLCHADTLSRQGCVVSRTGYTGEDGIEIMAPATQAVELWEELVRRGAKPCGLGPAIRCVWKRPCRCMATS